jgi:hypothetical protein
MAAFFALLYLPARSLRSAETRATPLGIADRLGRIAEAASRFAAVAGRALALLWAVLVLGLLVVTASGFWAG